MCDKRKRPCKKVSVMGSGFLNSTNMTCHVKEFTVTLLTFSTLLFQCFYVAAVFVVVVFFFKACTLTRLFTIHVSACGGIDFDYKHNIS